MPDSVAFMEQWARTEISRRYPGCRWGWRALLAAGLAASAVSQDLPDKRPYHLLNPTPRERMRELSTDRPDQTESPYTVDAGHFQMEGDVISATVDRDRSGGDDVRTSDFRVAALNLKVGLLNNVDLQFLLDSYAQSRIEDRGAGTTVRASGFGDVVTRLKLNLWGNDGGRTALAIMPFVKWPLAQSGLRNGETEGGIILPLAVELPWGWGLGAQTEFDFVADGTGGYDTEYFNTVTFGRDLIGNLGGYVEFAALVTPESGEAWQGQVDVGFTYGLTENIQLDFGCNFGVTESAPDYNPFLGITFRF